MNKSLLSLVLILQLVSGFAFSKVLTTEQRLADFTQLNLSIDSSYGPLLYKQQVRGLKLQELRDKYQALIRQSKTNSDFYYLIVKYISEFHDGHFGALIPTDYKAEIAIQTDLIDGKVLIGDVDRKKLSEKDFPFVKGDEVISLDGVPALQVVDTLSESLGGGFVLSEKRTAAQALFSRSARRFPVPTGSVVVQVRHGISDIIDTVSLKWEVSGTPFDEQMGVQSFNQPAPAGRTQYNSLSVKPMLEELFGPERLEKSFRCSGNTRIAIPADATVIMREPFVAYYHPTEKGNVGYLRIPHYSFEKPQDAFKQYEYVVDVLEKNTVGLIIDQDHNCGGSVDFLHYMVGLFISEPVKPMQFQLLASKSEYFQFKGWMTESVSDSIEYKQMEKVLSLIKSAWELGDYLTPKTSISGEDWIYPNRIHYTKPIVMLIDELAGSGGDAFPSLMGGYKRATLLGTRTWGLGGHVEELPPLYNSAINVRMTKSLFYRPDGTPVENNGAVPDVNYSITRDDYLYDYKNYQKFYLKTLLEKVE